MKPKLISFKLCPFVQRVNIVLKKKAVDFELSYIDLSDPPEWFKSLSPFGRVPLLQVEDGVLFESAAIVEYLEDKYEPKLHPNNLVLRSMNRAWVEVSNEMTWCTFHLSVKESEEAFKQVCSELSEKLARLESSLNFTPYFNGEAFSIVDANYAPLFQRIAFLEELGPEIIDCNRYPKVCNWRNYLLEDEAVKRSHVPELKSLYFELLAKRQGYISTCLDKQKYEHIEQKSLY